MTDLAVIVPTLRRPEGLERALRSLMAQTSVADRLSEIVVADNDPAGSARALVERLAAESPVPILWRHAPVPGVATARNVGLAATDAPLIAFLDDDEAAAPDWLAELLKAHEALGADVTFSPIRGVTPDGTGWARPYLDRFFGREGPTEDRLIDEPFGCGASLMTRAAALPGPAPFDVAANETGGEDDALFTAVRQRGGKFGWAARAWVEEYAPPHRATLGYALRRAFAYGQGPSQQAVRERRPLALIRWMVVGAAQAGIFGLKAIALKLAGRPSRAEAWDRAARGLGKVLWMPGLEPRFYGQAELRRLDAAG